MFEIIVMIAKRIFQIVKKIFQSDLLSAVAPASIALLVSNPPYVPGADAANMQAEVRDWEPHVALFACDDGFEIYQRLIGQAMGIAPAHWTRLRRITARYSRSCGQRKMAPWPRARLSRH